VTDTVWIRLTDIDDDYTFYMFGPTGIVEFLRDGDHTLLYRARGGEPDKVKEDVTYIMDTIGKIRKTLKKKPNRKIKR
jgi:hypothetical protein